MYVKIDEDFPDVWQLLPIVSRLRNGALGVVPTDTNYAFVCDMGHREAMKRLYQVKDLHPTKPLSILCRDLSMISDYTGSIPNAHFRAIRRCLPGPYTFVMKASTLVPRTMLRKQRTIGIRMPDDPSCIAILEDLDRPLLCTSVRTPDDSFWNKPAEIEELYGKRLDFVVDGGERLAEPSSIVDLTGPVPEIIRRGKGDVGLFE